MHGVLRVAWFFSILLSIQKVRSEPQVYILAENLEQVVTSSTLQWIPFNGHKDVALKNAVISAHQIRERENGTEDVEDRHEEVPVYVCRAKVAAIWVPGQYRKGKDKQVCIVSSYRKVSEEKNFEILINREKRSRLSWFQKSRYTLIPQGSVQGSDSFYVARRPVKYHRKDGALTHTAGNFNPSENLGVFLLVDQNNKELKFEDGEVLVEQEPIRYEFKHTKFDRIKSKHKHHPRILGTTVLKNEVEGVQRVDTVLSYNYTHFMDWGKDHGLIIALPFSVNMPNGTEYTGKWGIPKSINRTETVPIERYLEEGTAVNVTLKGNYTESDIPYISTVTAFYKDNEVLESLIRDSLLMKYMTGVVIEFGPVYFLSNNTLVPTTTTTARTTSITTTLTSKTQTISVPMPNTEDIYMADDKSKKSVSNEVVPNDVEPVPAGNTEDNTVQQLTKKDDSDDASSITICPFVIISSVIIIHIT
ncbi:protein unzipped [Harmonia axyridis]|uniref:protein unzipped n=1 Tax=Harmonia axyridis TaxID=115357 RepID=UPI001E27683E|nr:protein unzipped [Harmonia axyridis]XP_045471637.1 protein unzipped [Harmonia axyridis]